MKKKAGKKLQIARETLRDLDNRLSADEDLAKAAGGSGFRCSLYCLYQPEPTDCCSGGC